MKPEDRITQNAEAALQKVLWRGLILVLIGLVAAGTWSLVRNKASGREESADRSTQRLPVYGSVPDFSLIERSGRKVERSDLLGKIWVTTFIYTRCRETCPAQSAELARLQMDFGGDKDFRTVSFTIDPGRDTPWTLSRYAARLEAHPERWLFLTGNKGAIDQLAQEGFHLGGHPDRGKRAATKASLPHSSRLGLVDRRARIRGYYDSSDIESLTRLRRDVKTLLKEE